MEDTMTSSIDSSRQEPLHQKPNRTSKGLNETLNTDYIDIAPDDTSLFANTARAITSIVSSCCTPRQILIVLRVLKALTFAFLVFTVVADLMFIFFIEIKASEEVLTKVGGTRDTVIRVYGLILTIIALMIELDIDLIVKNFAGLKSFITRAFLLFFVATITSSSPLHNDYKGRTASSNGDDAYNDDDTNGKYTDQQVSQEIPSSTVIFQMVTSLIL